MGTNGTNNAAKTMTRGWRQFHIWSRTWPSYNRRYEGYVWAGDETEAGDVARRQFGNGKLYDVQGGKWGPLIRKGA